MLQTMQKDFTAVSPTPAMGRIASVDALRGFSIFWIIGADGALLALGDISTGMGPVPSAIGGFLGTQVTHVAWEGFRFYDLVFPLFIFVTGISIVFSLSRLVEREGLARAHVRVFRRALLLYGLGLIVYGGVSQHWSDIRYVGVLQRIGICYLFASLIFLNMNVRGMTATFVSLLVGYWALMTLVPVPGIGAGSFAPDANLANWLDAHYLPGRLWDRTRDPEGMLSTLPAIGSCLIGVMAGLLLKRERMMPQTKSLWLFGVGVLMVGVGYLWGLQFPVIKAIWTSSFVLVAGGYGLMLLGALYQIVDVWGYRRWSLGFVWLGANAITLYFLNSVSGFQPFARRFVGGDLGELLDRLTTPGAANFVTHLLGLAIAIALAGYFYRHKIFLRV